jgi:hypothetical protein
MVVGRLIEYSRGALSDVAARVVDDAGNDVPDGQPGEMLVRHLALHTAPRLLLGLTQGRGNNQSAAWAGCWFQSTVFHLSFAALELVYAIQKYISRHDRGQLALSWTLLR